MHHQYLQQHRQFQQQQYEMYRQEFQRHQALKAPHGHRSLGHKATSSAYDLGRYPSGHHVGKGRTANELAWERHCYYQQQQHQEEALAELRRREGHWQAQQRVRQRQQRHEVAPQPPESATDVRASSLTSITQASLPPQATKDLGLSRSRSAAAYGTKSGSKSKAKDTFPQSSKGSGPTKSILADCSILSAGRRLLRRSNSKNTKTSKTLDTSLNVAERNRPTPSKTGVTPKEQSSLEPATTPVLSQDLPTTSLTRKKTLKDIAPSIRSLARRCSSRFSSRPNSFAGSSSDPILQFTDTKAANGSLNAEISHVPQPLIPGPDGIVDLKQVVSQDTHEDQGASTMGYRPPTVSSTPYLPLETAGATNNNSNDNTSERTPIHRKVAHFRSKTTSIRPASGVLDDDTHDDMTPSSSTAPSSTNVTITTATTTTIKRAKSLSARARDSLRLANGRGLDLSFSIIQPDLQQPSETTTMMTTSLQGTEQSEYDLDKALPENPIVHYMLDKEQQEVAKRQIMGLLAMGRKERISAKTGQAIAVRPVPNTNSSGTCLSPLALEAQEDLSYQASTTDWDRNQKPAWKNEDPCQRIAFMLVPKSRYEFQPLVMA
ncbi:hypothetical protein BGZ65_009532 [Modicella reniformis]|uniref:Uncharacterized protein n=1 Tax=Modicella reniformis TaxID=1440133 RepID=A0A9P6ITH2_9FUNG|nr:hypothetical protein BGZ65_009532 [Modicella reniformis]